VALSSTSLRILNMGATKLNYLMWDQVI